MPAPLAGKVIKVLEEKTCNRLEEIKRPLQIPPSSFASFPFRLKNLPWIVSALRTVLFHSSSLPLRCELRVRQALGDVVRWW